MLTQMLMLLAVAGIYVYNLVLLPIEPGVGFWRYLCALFGFLNMGMIGFVLAAAALRFVFPVLALEGKAFYLIRVSPLSTWRYLLTKLLSNSIVFIFFALLLTWLSMTLLVPGDKIFTLGLVNAIFLPIGIVAWNLGLGIFFPNTGLSSVTEAPASFGGFMTMMISVFYVVLVLGFQSVYVFERFWKWHVIGEAGYEFWWGTALVISAVVIITGWIIPMVLAAKKLENGDGIL
jgi:ABC-2 type transport system permease protein